MPSAPINVSIAGKDIKKWAEEYLRKHKHVFIARYIMYFGIGAMLGLSIGLIISN